jgi:hypothetical protein
MQAFLILTDIDTDMDTYTNSDREHDKDFAAASGRQVHIWSRPWDTWNSGDILSLRVLADYGYKRYLT